MGKLFWPPGFNATKKIKYQMVPESNWKLFDVHIKYSNISSYDEARCKEENLFKVGGTDTEIEKRRLQKERKKHPVTHNTKMSEGILKKISYILYLHFEKKKLKFFFSKSS